MKRMITILFMLLLIPLSCSAISLEELQSNPEHYKNIFEAPEATVYVDSNSIKSIRNTPPYYALQVKLYYVIYDMTTITESACIFSYNKNRSSAILANKIIAENPTKSYNEQNDIFLSELEKNCGMTFSEQKINHYKFNGKLDLTGTPSYNNEIKYNTNMARVAKYIFKQYYKYDF